MVGYSKVIPWSQQVEAVGIEARCSRAMGSAAHTVEGLVYLWSFICGVQGG